MRLVANGHGPVQIQDRGVELLNNMKAIALAANCH